MGPSQGFNAIQENGYNVVLKLGALQGGQAQGSAYYHTGSDFRRVNGAARLSFYKDDHFEITVRWETSQAGRFDQRPD